MKWVTALLAIAVSMIPAFAAAATCRLYDIVIDSQASNYGSVQNYCLI